VLVWLSIQGLALVDSIELEFAPGLNVLTGETGAGKSLILGSVGLLLGERADGAWLRQGAARGFVEGTFDLSARPDLLAAMRALEIEPEEERVVLRREIAADGKSRALVNGRTVLVTQLRAAGDLLVDLHGQHEHQQLLHADRQTDFFDTWAGTLEDRRVLAAERAELLEDRRRVQAARAALERDRAEEENLRADLAELEAAALEPGEEEALLRDRERLAHRERLAVGLGDSLAAIADEDQGAEPRFRRAVKALRAAAALDPGLSALVADAESAAQALASLAERIEEERDGLFEEPLDLDGVEERLARIHRLKRKHAADVAGLAALRLALRERVRSLGPGGADVEKQTRALAERTAAYDRGLDRLTAARGVRLAPFSSAVGELLGRLGFGKASLRVVGAAGAAPMPPGRPLNTVAAIDPAPIPALEFEFQPNPGEPPRPLRRIASGGELSRVMLAVKSLMAEKDQVSVLVFDEVDQGIGGAVGEEVGRLLSALGARRQVLCITHLPLIAAHAGRQFQVTKSTEKGRTATSVHPLEEEDRVEEIARLLAGARVSDTTRLQARELLQAAVAPARGSKRASVTHAPSDAAPARRAARGKR
jgi:DNA repair protein RecN (Recombination protein N)